MFRLRTTTSLSVLALLVGVAGTAWLSTLTGDWKGPAPATVSHVDKVRTVLRRHARPARAQPAPLREPITTTAAMPRAEAAPALPSLTPIEMPSLPGSLFGHAALGQGRVVLRLAVDGDGRAQSASVAQSSGDAALDDRAVRMALGWRFAVPADHPAGLTGQLVMRFDE
ncbi:TonB family protein [Dyella sp. EPa41]|uniref:energy transducer TonB n=1 Tax=Dyella sp. EPa41 TaxID=1561194 RepID=UPI001915D382|nr:TonB family protein [Dyella sp. EPa41]